MQGQLANLISLIAYGNSYLAFADEDALSRAEEHFGVSYIYPDFLFERHLSGADNPGTVVAASPDAWFRWLREMGAERLSYIAFAWNGERTPGLSEAAAAGFSGGTPMAIQAEMPGGRIELWYPSWNVDRTDLTKTRVWKVRYHGVAGKVGLRAPFTVEFITSMLGRALSVAADFARRHAGNGPWAGIFGKALATLTGAALPPRGPLDALPRFGYGDAARRLLASADQAWVFGGMGSWNDLGWSEPDIQAEYEAVTGKLYEAVKAACVTAANAFDPALHP